MARSGWTSLVPAWAAIRLRTLLILMALFALGLDVIVQHRRGAAREAELKQKYGELLMKASGERAVRETLGDLGMVILEDPSRVEVLRVSPHDSTKSRKRSGGEVLVYNTQITGEELGRDFVSKLAGILLDGSNYSSSDDLSDPEVGFRVWRGKDSIELLFGTPYSGSEHVDLWVYVRNDRGELVHGESWWRCLDHPDLSKLFATPSGSSGSVESTGPDAARPGIKP